MDPRKERWDSWEEDGLGSDETFEGEDGDEE